MSGDARGGNDTLVGGTARDFLHGDAANMSGNARGGDDTLHGGAGDDHLFGDAALMADNAVGGADRFVFAPGDGADTIHDFVPGQDVIDLTAYGISFAALDTNGGGTLDNGDDPVAIEGADTLIDLAGVGGVTGDQLAVLGITGLAAGDFTFIA